MSLITDPFKEEWSLYEKEFKQKFKKENKENIHHYVFPQYPTSTEITQGCQSDKELKACSHQLPGNSFEQKKQQYFIFLQINISQKFN